MHQPRKTHEWNWKTSKTTSSKGKKVILDYELAKLYEVETRALKQAVRRNIERF
ncbi:MAG: hypothetical protein EBR91_01825, partial [Flavobacteriia bacterium]|nr:hypothetical protein [Flavobacteriia bacterium]